MLQKSDVSGCFDNINKDLLLTKLRSFLFEFEDSLRIVNLISSFLRTAILDKRGRDYSTPGKGIPQGSPISPILMNIYLHSLDMEMGAFKGELYYLRYADDIVLGFRDQASISRLTQAFKNSLRDLNLEVKSAKIWPQKGGRSPELKVLGRNLSISSAGIITSSFPFKDVKKKLSVIRIEEKMAKAPKMLSLFFPIFLDQIREELNYLTFFPSTLKKASLKAYLNQLLRSRSKEYLHQRHPADFNQYKSLLYTYSKKLYSLISSLPPLTK